MKEKNTNLITGIRTAPVESHSGLSDAVIIEIVHGIKEIIIEFIDRKCQPVVHGEER